jgi:hypothetical protein
MEPGAQHEILVAGGVAVGRCKRAAGESVTMACVFSEATGLAAPTDAGLDAGRRRHQPRRLRALGPTPLSLTSPRRDGGEALRASRDPRARRRRRYAPESPSEQQRASAGATRTRCRRPQRAARRRARSSLAAGRHPPERTSRRPSTSRAECRRLSCRDAIACSRVQLRGATTAAPVALHGTRWRRRRCCLSTDAGATREPITLRRTPASRPQRASAEGRRRRSLVAQSERGSTAPPRPAACPQMPITPLLAVLASLSLMLTSSGRRGFASACGWRWASSSTSSTGSARAGWLRAPDAPAP